MRCNVLCQCVVWSILVIRILVIKYSLMYCRLSSMNSGNTNQKLVMLLYRSPPFIQKNGLRWHLLDLHLLTWKMLSGGWTKNTNIIHLLSIGRILHSSLLSRSFLKQRFVLLYARNCNWFPKFIISHNNLNTFHLLERKCQRLLRLENIQKSFSFVAI